MLTQTTRRSRHASKNWRFGGGGGSVWGVGGNGPLSSFLPFYFRVSGPDYLSLEQANSDVMDDIMSEKVNEVLKSYTLLYLKIKVKLCHSPSV